MSRDKDFLTQDKEKMVAELAAQAERNLIDVVPKLSQGSAREILEMLEKQLPPVASDDPPQE